METLTVVAAIIEYKHRYLILRRAASKDNPGLWEFPGGKLQNGESLQQAIEREIFEELNVKATAGSLRGSCDTLVDNKIIRLIGIDVVIENEPTEFRDHSELKWASWDELSTYPLTLPDLGLLQYLQSNGFRESELSKLNVSSCAKFYGIMYAVVGVFMSAFILVTPSSMSGFLSFTQKMIIVGFMPFFNFFIGAVLGVLLAVTYNIFASIFGGLKMRLK
ncbi:MAG: DUF3566 domain-containing protein [Oligoflexia bacterium]|nr:DUF3566 domain-containing protein [Oligoflexia bacterium]